MRGATVWRPVPAALAAMGAVSDSAYLCLVMSAGTSEPVRQLVSAGPQSTQAAQHNVRRSPQQAAGLLHLSIQEVQAGQVTSHTDVTIFWETLTQGEQSPHPFINSVRIKSRSSGLWCRVVMW